MDEYERLEGELKRLYGIYLERFRNVEYLENDLEMYNREEQAKLDASEKVLKHMQDKIREEELSLLREGKQAGTQDGGGSDEEFGLTSADSFPVKSRTVSTNQPSANKKQISRNNYNNAANNKKQVGNGKVLGSMSGGNDSDSESMSDSGSISASSDIEASDVYDPTVDDIDDDLSDDDDF